MCPASFHWIDRNGVVAYEPGDEARFLRIDAEGGILTPQETRELREMLADLAEADGPPETRSRKRIDSIKRSGRVRS